MNALSLYELNLLVKQTLRTNLTDPFWIQAELSEVRTNYAGHCYVEFIQKEEKSNTLIAKARGNIWRNTYAAIKPYFEQETGQLFTAGIKVMVQVTIDFHEVYGYSLTVIDIDPTYTLGDMARQRREILARLEEEGVLNLNKELELPILPQRIAVISSATAAGYDDFCNQLQKNSYGFVFYLKLFPAIMQGNLVEESIIHSLNAIYEQIEQWDVVVIIRGGGATSDLNGFDTYNLAANCAQFPLPIITGIGHERDDTVLDYVSHTRVKTPTAAAEFFIDQMHSAEMMLKEYADHIIQSVTERIEGEKERISRIAERIPIQIQLQMQSERFRQERLLKQIQSTVNARISQEQQRFVLLYHQIQTASQLRIQKEKHQLQLWEEQIKMASPERLLERGYSITFLNGKVVTNVQQIKCGDKLETHLKEGRITSIVTE